MDFKFGDGMVSKVESKEIIKLIFETVESVLKLPNRLSINNYIGPQPVSIDKQTIKNLKNGYVVCEKSDGERYLLVCIIIKDNPMCFMLNRNNEIFFIGLTCKREILEGSIFDGELVKNKFDKWVYMIHDCFSYNGVSFVNRSHMFRYACIIDFILKRYTHIDSDPFFIKTKIFYNYGNSVVQTWKHINMNSENKIDGLIFTPIDAPVEFGRQWSLYKWKEPGNNTIDFLINYSPERIILYGCKKESMYVFKTFLVNDKNYTELLKYIKTNSVENNTIIEFKYIVDNEIFIPYRIRNDKKLPNSEQTIKNTIQNIVESIKINELI